jgi:hypothetical protein
MNPMRAERGHRIRVSVGFVPKGDGAETDE